MAISFRCQSCGKPYRVSDHLAGTVVTCTTCKGPMSVPNAGEAAGDFASSAPPRPTAPPTPMARTAVQPAPTAAPRPMPIRPPPARAPKLASEESPWLLLTEEAARLVSMLLVLLLLGGVVYFAFRLGNSERIPDSMAGRMRLYIGLYAVFLAAYFFIIAAPTIFLATALACNWTKFEMPGGAYIRSAGVASLPYLIIMAFIAFALQKNLPVLLGIMILAPVLCVLALKELMGLKWSSAGIAAALLIVLMPGVGLISSFVTMPITFGLQKLARVDKESIAQWARENPDEYWAWRRRANESSGEQSANLSLPPPPPPPPRPAKPDPYAGKLEPLLDEVRSAVRQAPQQTREHVRAMHAQYAADFKPYAPSNDSPLWANVNSQLAELSRLASEAPSEMPGEPVFKVIEDRPLPVAKIEAAELSKDVFAFKSIRIRPLADSKIDLNGYAVRDTLQRWSVGRQAMVEISLLPVRDDRQQRPWVANRRIIEQLADRKNLLAVVMEGEPEVSHGRMNNIAWTRIATRRGVRSVENVRYVGRTKDGWINVELTGNWIDQAACDAADKFVQGIATPTIFDETAEDPFAPARVAARFGEPYVDPVPVLKAQGAAGIQAVRELIARLGEQAPAAAKKFLEQEADPKIVAATAGPLDVKLALTTLRNARFPSEKQTALKQLASAPVDSNRDEVAAELERILSSESFLEEESADALMKWWRPQTVVVLLPLLEENGWADKRAAAMKVLAQTRDHRAVYPIVRWIIKEPERVVVALSAMGPVAEDEVIKLLREKNADVRASACRILDQIGTQKCLIELRRAANDPRDAAAAGVAKRALTSVLQRVKAARATTAPATTQARR